MNATAAKDCAADNRTMEGNTGNLEAIAVELTRDEILLDKMRKQKT